MRKLLCALSLVCYCSTSGAQPGRGDFSLITKFHLLNAISPVRPYLQGSAEFIFLKKIGIELGYGRRYAYNLPVFGEKVDSLTFGKYGRNLLLEVSLQKISVNISKRHFQFHDFAGISYRNLRDERNVESNLLLDSNEMHTGKDLYGIKTSTDAWALRWGVRIFSNRLWAESFAEFGVKNISQGSTGYDDDHTHKPYTLRKFSADGYRSIFNVGVKIGLVIF